MVGGGDGGAFDDNLRLGGLPVLPPSGPCLGVRAGLDPGAAKRRHCPGQSRGAYRGRKKALSQEKSKNCANGWSQATPRLWWLRPWVLVGRRCISICDNSDAIGKHGQQCRELTLWITPFEDSHVRNGYMPPHPIDQMPTRALWLPYYFPLP